MGQDVVLPCHLSPQRDARSLDVRWIRDKFFEIVHHYRNGQDLYGGQMGAYAGRTELARDGLSAGILDLRITGLRPSDDGQYVCTVGDGHAYDEAIVELEVSGAIIVTGSVEGSLSCVVRNSRIQQEREFSLHIAAPFFHNAQPWMVALALVLVLLAVSIGLGVYLFVKKSKLAAQEWSRGGCSAGTRVGLEQGALGGRPGSMATAWGWWQGAAPLQIFPPSNQAALLTTCSSAFAFQWHRAESWVSPCSPCPQPLGKWCLCGRAWSGWALGACVLVARGCCRSSWSLGWELGVLGLGLPWAQNTAGMAERNGDQGGNGE
uniref:Ig-like domain-containing protein n=1 Tax=Anas platyrhynchos platyrhynchos TaxID=8840 RepID=A0A493T883_ANAPP